MYKIDNMMNCKVFVVLLTLIISCTINLKAQKSQGNAPQIMYIIKGKEVSKLYVEKLFNDNRIKGMRKGISTKEKSILIKKYGDRVKDCFVAVIDVFSEDEMKDRNKLSPKEKERIIQKEIEESSARKKHSTIITVGEMAPDFVVEMLDGSKIKLSDLRGKVVLLNFWATWCAPCMKEFIEIPDKILVPFKSEDFVLLPISRGEKREDVMKKMERLKLKGIDFPVGVDPKKEIYSRYAQSMIPRNFLINKEGKVVFVSIGYDEDKLLDISKKIKMLLNK